LFTLQNSTVEEALRTMADNALAQPTLFRTQNQFFVKADNTAINISSASCFAEAVDFLFMCFWVFGVSYPEELRLFYGCLERVKGMRLSVANSPVLQDFFRELSALECDSVNE
jgi:hypothetical protein